MMLRRWQVNGALLTAILVLFGCGASMGVDSGVEPTKTLALDNGFEFSVSVDKGDELGLDMPEPDRAEYRIEGASFDPTMFRLDHFLTYEKNGRRRAQYMFAILLDGSSDILIKMRAGENGPVQLYKRITVKVGGDHGLF